MHRYCRCSFANEHALGETYCSEQCNKDTNCKGYMKRMDDKMPERFCGIVTNTLCTEFMDVPRKVECFEEKMGAVGDLLPNSTCKAGENDFWSGCYIKFGKQQVDIQVVNLKVKY